jgi:hypothetical protein
VEEGLDFGGGLPGDGAEFGEGEFAGEGDAGEAEAGGGADAFEVVEGHLGGGVETEGGEVLAGEAGDAEVLHDDGVGAAFGAKGEGADEIGEFSVADEGVEGDVDAAGAGLAWAKATTSSRSRGERLTASARAEKRGRPV